MSLIKVPFLLSSAVGLHVACTAPSAPTSDEVIQLTPREIFLRGAAILTSAIKGCFWLGALGEMGTIILPRISPSKLPPSAFTLLKALGGPDTRPITAAFLFGTTLVSFGGFLRWQCYRTLGRFFTFQLSVRKDHRLVTTGLYSIVRHPSYTASMVCMCGAAIMHGHSGSWLRKCGILESVLVRITVISWFAFLGICLAVLPSRARQEDEMMMKEFGKEWEEWASRVKYRLIPWVF